MIQMAHQPKCSDLGPNKEEAQPKKHGLGPSHVIRARISRWENVRTRSPPSGRRLALPTQQNLLLPRRTTRSRSSSDGNGELISSPLLPRRPPAPPSPARRPPSPPRHPTTAPAVRPPGTAPGRLSPRSSSPGTTTTTSLRSSRPILLPMWPPARLSLPPPPPPAGASSRR